MEELMWPIKLNDFPRGHFGANFHEEK